MTLTQKLRLFGRFAARAWALSAPYFRSDERWRARAMLAAIVLLNLASVYMLVLINDWYRLFYDALEARNQPVFWEQLMRFAGLAAAFIVVSVYRFYLTQLLQMHWRAWLSRHTLDRWLSAQTHYRMELRRFAVDGASPDNPDQRIQEDMRLFTEYTVTLSMGLLNAVVTLVSFVGILWTLSGGFDLPLGDDRSLEIPGFMVWMAVLYCLVGSVLTHYIGRPQIDLNFRQQRYEADFRHHLIRVREHSEAIALDRGEAVERAQLDGRLGAVLANYLRLIRAQKRLIWFTTFFGQAAVVFPFIVAAPRFFSGAIQLGELMQIASAFGRVQDSLAWFVDNYSQLAAWRATTDRLTGFEDSFSSLRENPSRSDAIVFDDDGADLQVSTLALTLPDGRPLLEAAGLTLAPGGRVLLQGPSGSGKSTLLRALAGIWPWGRGRVRRPADFSARAMFIPQQPYFPDGPLREALAYPEPATRYDDDTLRQALHDAELPTLVDRLDEAAAWGQRLSGGERQRLALARAFLKRPRWLFADEATSALDGSTRQRVLQRLAERLRHDGGAWLEIAHGPTGEPGALRWTLQRRGDAAAVVAGSTG